jgi:succinoglycan biosynthesis transport protein ExoP
MHMLQQERGPSVGRIGGVAEAAAPAEALQSILDLFRRQYFVIAFAAAIMLALGFIYVLTARPSYTASATMVIDTKSIQLFQQQSVFSDLPMDQGAIESQVEILKSENIALAVIKQLDLTEDPEFVGPGGGLIGTLFSVVTGLFASDEPDPDSKFALTRRAVNVFENRLNIRRVGLTYVIVISFRSFSPDRAAQIANAVADAYVDDKLQAKYESARRAGAWLQTRLRELREQASTAERVVVAFKNKNEMVDAGGRTINEQQLAELNSELVLARSRTSEARARVDRVQSVLQSNLPEATVTATVADTLKNEVITKLRSQYLELSRREADWAVRYGANHLAVVNLRNQMREMQNSIRNELQRIAETYKSDLEISKQHEDSVQRQLDQAVLQSQSTNEAQVALRELESNAQTYRALYDNFLQRYMESVQQQSFPITDARVISAATRPLHKSNPRTMLVLGLATMVGLAFGLAAGAWREFADRVFRTSKQIESFLQSDCIALVPIVKEGAQKSKTTDIGRGVKLADQAREVQKAEGAKSPDAGQQMIARPPGVYSMIVDSPFSAFAEAIRSIKVAIDLSPTMTGGKIIGFTSSVPNEGKSSVAAAVAQLTAQTGARTILVDCDLRNPALTRSLSPKAACGLLEVVRGQATLERAVWSDHVTNMRFLPAAMKARMAHSSEVLASGLTRKFFDSLRHSYDYVIVDFAPLVPIVDVRASTNLVDGYVYVVEWGRTRISFVEQALGSARGVHEHLLGVVLNKVDLGSVGRYDGYGGGYYNHKNYHRYGYTE